MNSIELYLQWCNRYTLPKNVWDKICELEYAIQREMAPIYTLGSPSPQSYSGRRGIAGTFSVIIPREHIKTALQTIEDNGINCVINGLCYIFHEVSILNDTDFSTSYSEYNASSNMHTFTFVAKACELPHP